MNEQLNIGFDAKRAFKNATGLGNYSRNLLHALSKYYPQNRYHLYTPDTGHGLFQPLPDAYTIHTPHTVADRLVPSFWRSARLGKYIKQAGLDVYHGLSHELPRDIHTSGVKTVVTMHDLIYLRYPELYPWWDRKIYDRKFRFAVRSADRIMAISQQTRQDLIDILDTPEEKITVVYQSCAPEFFNAPVEHNLKEIRRKYGLPERYVLYVGSFTRRKQVLNLCRAFDRILEKIPDVHLVLLGNGGEQLPKIKDYVTTEKADHKHLIRAAPNVDLPAIYQMAELFVYPSLFEGFGIPIIEALASGVPVITTEGGCFPEAGGLETAYVSGGDVEALTTEMEAILTDKARQQTMITAGKGHAQNFTPEKFAQAMMQVYEGLMD